ncbi:restriction endonuclease subunit S [Bartonella sp. A05]|uniref:restriction endonuclease subunit S n=1 Tax=Bartonella sp. A05 TaxID=2967261 RepID=UPI0022A9441E|nr:restriction endonuclease subunit S [Bartonella sp. A05]MCZ2204435.1 restriction endonuclease subunit S [Bartonella sp. A05]
MSRIDDLIKQYCPNGVEYKELQELFEMKYGYTPSKSNKKFWVNGAIPWFRMDDIRKNGTILSESLQKVTEEAIKGDRLFPANSIIIAIRATIGEHALITVPHLANERFISLSLKSAFSKKMDIRFVYYYCFVLDNWCLVNTKTSHFSSVNITAFKRFKFPIPPLPVQQEIVDILDNFTKLEAELEAELEARKKQYTYYRNTLLSFNKIGSNIKKESCFVRWRTLGEVGIFVRGHGLQKKDFTESGIGCIHYGQIYTHYGVYADQTKTFISESLAKKLRKAKKGNLVIATTSENDEDVCKAVAWLGDEEIAVSGDAYIYEHSLNPKYVSYFFQTDEFQKQKKTLITGTKVRRVSGDNMSKINIPVPPLPVQQEIVNILDKFDALVNDISIGLPAEITARRQQYEYYRNQLLTFQEAM